jgi:hypothetical protein
VCETSHAAKFSDEGLESVNLNVEWVSGFAAQTVEKDDDTMVPRNCRQLIT